MYHSPMIMQKENKCLMVTRKITDGMYQNHTLDRREYLRKFQNHSIITY
jgi:hypothetical protein